jgi:hypothetical protein
VSAPARAPVVFLVDVDNTLLTTSPAADLTVERIGDLVDHDLSTLRARAGAGAAAGPASGR